MRALPRHETAKRAHNGHRQLAHSGHWQGAHIGPRGGCDDGTVITTDLARDLHTAGLLWSPLPGDRFTVDMQNMLGDVFYLADMTVDVQRFVGGSVIGFNGVAEWALDSVDLEETLWLPREDQMRAVLGEAFVALTRNDAGYAVSLATSVSHDASPHQDAECAYAIAVLAFLSGRNPG